MNGSRKVELQNGERRELGGVWRRGVARFIDLLVVGIPIAGFYFVVALVRMDWDFDLSSWEEMDWYTGELVWANLLSVAAIAVYEIWQLSTRCQTVGKKVMEVKVVRVSDGGLPNPLFAFQRLILYGLFGTFSSLFSGGGSSSTFWSNVFGLLVMLVFLTALLDRNQRGIYDKMSRTVVVRV